MEQRLIDDSPVIEQIGCDIAAIDSVEGKPCIVPLIIRDYLQSFIDLLKQQPTVDAVQVTRCRDCKYWSHNTQFCSKWSNGFVAHRTPYDYYCADGERRSDEQ